MRWLLAAFLLSFTNPSKASVSDERCKAYATYRESSGEPLRGSKAVLEVLENRMKAAGKSCMAIVAEKGQFSWSKRKIVMKLPQKWLTRWEEVRSMPPVLPSCAMWFHNNAIRKPDWAKRKRLVAKIHRHYFYC
jgi:spore germination cell wall hydrolase CwlJ-like protein